MVEGAAFSELAFAGGLPVLAWLSLVVRVNCAKSGLSEVLWEWLMTKKVYRVFWYLHHLAVSALLGHEQIGSIKQVGNLPGRGSACTFESYTSA